jgi:hypothetical protein
VDADEDGADRDVAPSTPQGRPQQAADRRAVLPRAGARDAVSIENLLPRPAFLTRRDSG